jgi:tripeptide aminopeptidase
LSFWCAIKGIVQELLMPRVELEFDEKQAVGRLLKFLSVGGITGQERAIGKTVVRALMDVGISRRAIHFDDANQRIPLPTETGNLIVQLPGTHTGRRRLFSTHLDTVSLCAGAKPKQKNNRIVAAGKTALGGDNRTGVACLVTLIATLIERNLPHPPLTFLFTVREESGLWGARCVDLADLGNPVEGYNVDGSSPAEITIGAVGAERWEAEIIGKAAHAGAHPERGISATAVASLAIADVVRGGWFGKISKDGKAGTSNVGSFGGEDGTSAGEATNVVTDYVRVRGEARSHDMRFVRRIVTAYQDAFRASAAAVRDADGKYARIKFRSRRDYYPFRLPLEAPVVQNALTAARWAGIDATTRLTNGGLDANWLVRHGIPTITFGAGQRNVHTVEEYVDIRDFLTGCKLALALATKD